MMTREQFEAQEDIVFQENNLDKYHNLLNHYFDKMKDNTPLAIINNGHLYHIFATCRSRIQRATGHPIAACSEETVSFLLNYIFTNCGPEKLKIRQLKTDIVCGRSLDECIDDLKSGKFERNWKKEHPKKERQQPDELDEDDQPEQPGMPTLAYEIRDPNVEKSDLAVRCLSELTLQDQIAIKFSCSMTASNGEVFLPEDHQTDRNLAKILFSVDHPTDAQIDHARKIKDRANKKMLERTKDEAYKMRLIDAGIFENTRRKHFETEK